MFDSRDSKKDLLLKEKFPINVQNLGEQSRHLGSEGWPQSEPSLYAPPPLQLRKGAEEEQNFKGELN